MSAVALGAIATVGACTFTSSPENTSQDSEAQRRDYAQGRSENDADDAKTSADVAPPTSTAQDETLATFTPTEVASILEAINFGEVAQGRLAIRQAQSAHVRAFALHAVEVHGRGQERSHALLGLEPTMKAEHEHLMRDPTAGALLHQGVVLTNDMKSQTGGQFDMAYMTAQITGHAKELALIDHSLLPSALAAEPAAMQQGTTSSTPEVNAADLQAELKATRKQVAKHLVHALRIQQALRNPTGATPLPTGTPPPTGDPLPRETRVRHPSTRVSAEAPPPVGPSTRGCSRGTPRKPLCRLRFSPCRRA